MKSNARAERENDNLIRNRRVFQSLLSRCEKVFAHDDPRCPEGAATKFRLEELRRRHIKR